MLRPRAQVLIPAQLPTGTSGGSGHLREASDGPRETTGSFEGTTCAGMRVCRVHVCSVFVCVGVVCAHVWCLHVPVVCAHACVLMCVVCVPTQESCVHWHMSVHECSCVCCVFPYCVMCVHT